MDDGSSSSAVKKLKNEWALFWESIAGEEDDSEKDAFQTGKLEALTLEQLREITKALSQDRKKLNQKLESLNKELDLNAAKLESLRLVGGEDEATLKRIGELTDMGQTLSDQLNKLDENIRRARFSEDEIRAEEL